MDKVREIISEKLRQKGFTEKSLSLAIGKNPAYINQYLKRGFPSQLDEDTRENVAVLLGIEENLLRPYKGIYQYKKPIKKSLLSHRGGVMAESLPPFGPDLIPILGQANASMKAVILNYDEPLGELTRHPNQRGVKNAFYARIYDDSMEPRYRQGEHAAVNGGVMPLPREDCLVELKNGEIYVKQFIKQTSKELICRQLNPAIEWKRPIEDVKTLHAIVGRV